MDVENFTAELEFNVSTDSVEIDPDEEGWVVWLVKSQLAVSIIGKNLHCLIYHLIESYNISLAFKP